MAKKKPIVSPLGQWAYPGEVTIIPSSNITMKGVNYPVLGVDDLGNSQMMMPGQNYTFPGEYVTEYPQMQFGGMSKRKIDKILNQNKDLNFVQRLYQSNTPSIVIPGQQYPSTHFMESADGRVYPTVVQMPDGSLQYLADNAYNYANQTGEYIQFPNDRQARRFAKSYKKGTGVLEEFGKGGLRQWFAEEWTDVKTGKACGRSGDEKGSRPYPACRPKKRVNETTPKTTSEMSSAEKAKFKREKTSGKRIDYNHKRRQDGGEEDSTIENITEFFDPTGIMSWDDASKAYNEWKKSNSTLPSMNQALDMFGAVPGLGKLGKIKYLDPEAIKTAYKYIPWQQIVNAFDTVEDEASKVKKPIKKQDGGETWLDQYQDAGEIPSNIERMQGIDIKRKKKKVSDSPQYQYDNKGNLLYNPELNIQPYILDNSTRDSFLINPRLPVENLNPTLEEFINVASSYYPIDNKLVSDSKINLQPSNYQHSLEEEYVLPQYVGKSFGNLPIVKDDGYSPNRRWVSNLRAKDTGSKFSKDSYAYVLKTDPSNLVDYSKKNSIENAVSANNKNFYNYLAKNNYLPDAVEQLTKKLPDQIWNRAEQMRVEMRNNPEIMSWANLHNVDLGYKGKGESNDNFAPKIPESIYANRLVDSGLVTNRPDYDYAPMETYIVQDPSKFNLAGYFPVPKDYNEANAKQFIAKKLGVDPSAFNSGEYLIHYNQSPITEYTPGKKYGGWLEEYQSGGRPIYTSNPNDPRIKSYNDSNILYNSYLANLEKLKKIQQPVQTNDTNIKSNYTVQKDNIPRRTDTNRMIKRWNESSEGKKISTREWPVVARISNLENLDFDPIQQKFQAQFYPDYKTKKKFLDNNMYKQPVRQWYLTQGPDVIYSYRPPLTDKVRKISLKAPQVNSFGHVDLAHKYIKPIGIDKVYLDPVTRESYKNLIQYKRTGKLDSNKNIVQDSGWYIINDGKDVVQNQILNNNPLFIRRYAKPVQPYIYKKPEALSEVVESPTVPVPVPVVEPPKPSLIVSNIDRDMYTPGGGMAREYNIGVTLQDGNKKSFRTEKEYQDWKAANNLDISKAKVTEGRGYSYDYYPENKKLGGWLEEYQTGGYRYSSNPSSVRIGNNPSTTDNTRVVTQNTNVSAANRKAAEAAEYAKRVGSISQGKTKSDYEKAKEASSLVAQAEQRKGSADPLDYVLDLVNPATYGFAATDLVGNTAMGVNNLVKGNFSEAASNALNAGMNALYLAPALAELRGPLYTGIPKAFVNKSKAELERQAGVDWLKNWYGQPEIKQRFNQQIYNPAVADDLVMPIYKKNVVTDVIEKPNSAINLDKSVFSDLASNMSKEKYAELKYGFKNDPIISLKYGEDIPASHKRYLGVNSGFGNNMGGYTNVYPEHPEFFYNKFNPNSQWKPTVKGTSIHEGTHWLTTGDEGLAESTKAMFKEPFDLSKRVSKQDKYLTKPTEIHARLNELRSQYNLGPTVTQSQVDKIIADGLKGNTTVQKRFFELLKDNKSLTNLFNTAMGISAPLAAASQLPEQKNGGWLNKYK